MFELLPAPDHVVALKISGTLTADEYDRIVEAIEGRLARHERLGVLVDLLEFNALTGAAVLKDLRYALSKVSELRRFPREAMIAEKLWIRTLVAAARPIVPHVELRAFGADEREAAMAWVSEVAG